MTALTNHTIDTVFFDVYGRCGVVPVWISAVHEGWRVVLFPIVIMDPMQSNESPPRPAVAEELEDLLHWQISQKYGCCTTEEEMQDERALIEGSWIGVFDNYITDGPGYTGRVMFVVWPGSPNMFDVFTWNREGALEAEHLDWCKCRNEADGCEEQK